MSRKSIKDEPEKAAAKKWSYSAWATRRKCAFKYYCVFVRGMKEPERSDNRALERGIELHKMQEGYLTGKVTKLPKSFKAFEDHYAALKKCHPIVEQFWGVDDNWKPMKWGSWVVMKMDAAVLPSKKFGNVLLLQDLKSGREYPEHEDQGGLYSALGLAMFPKIEGVEVEFWYIDQGFSARYEYTRKQLLREREFWLDEGRTLLKVHPQKFYKPNPSDDACKWCHLRTDKGGPCDAWKVNAKIK
jgi:hypothetical protein